LLRRDQLDDELSDEMSAHLEQSTADYVASGMSLEDARRAARLRFGGTLQTAEAYRDRQGFPLLESMAQDIGFAFRLLVKDRGFTLAATIALALGIGVNNTVFTLVNAVLIRSLPFDEPDRIVSLGTRDARGRDGSVSIKDFEDWRRSARAFTGISAFATTVINLSDSGRTPEQYSGPYISANAFRLIGQRPLLRTRLHGRGRSPWAEPVVILGNGVWKTRGSDPSIVGRTIKVSEVPATVIGVMPEGFKFPINADAWEPLAMLPNIADVKRDVRYMQVFGRLAPGVTMAQAGAELDAIAANLAQDHPDTNKDIRATIMGFNERYSGGSTRLMLLALMGAVAFVLLIACANVANLLLARSSPAHTEISVRVSLVRPAATLFSAARRASCSR
jgi:hypothetical protein